MNDEQLQLLAEAIVSQITLAQCADFLGALTDCTTSTMMEIMLRRILVKRLQDHFASLQAE